MRNAQNVVKFGLKLGAFAALATALSSCFVVVETGTPTIALVTSPTNYCRGDGIERNSKLNFTFDLSNISGATLEAIVSSEPESNVSDPTKIPQENLKSTNSTTIPGANVSSLGSGRFNAFVTLKMNSKNEFLSLSSLNPKIGVGVSDIRLWVRAINGSTQTNWAKSPIISFTDCP
jgi:hypothetical protein